MRLTIDHRTRYSFSEPQTRLVQLLRMTPLDGGAQSVIDWTIDVECDARLRQGRDGYGNVTTMLYIEGPVSAVELMVRGEVLTDDRGGRVDGVLETLPPSFYLRETPLTAADDAVRALAASLARSIKTPANQAGLITLTLFERIATEQARTPKSRTAAETLARGSGIGRDKVHLMLALARTLGIPARFVSGHCLDLARPGGRRSGHCWAEIYGGEQEGWLAFDPSTGTNIGESHVRVAIGLDASDATPLSGTRTGGGIEELDVAIRVEASGAHAQ